ncbi:MAG: 16S rRNA (cytosine(967)-C(5))-methyltransferase RsmB [Pseudomonadales bacterium]|nr:16S rRNA (cytosine(967)-C(5))-methyltransferase RsmB [Pseudomonadales bacterium]NRA15762.1 16S rRNA (cytosine(967)-C(5))-methyltransferase RsmB [Oceanospirillaceae bacterium]
MNARLLAVKTLAPLLCDSGALKYSLQRHLLDCPENQKPLLQQICYGSMRYYPQLICIINKLVNKPLKTKDADIQALLLIGIYQLFKLRIPEHAAISETVEICKSLNKPWATSLVNATLRNFQRKQSALVEQLLSDNSFKYNHPQWFIEKLKHNWPDQWQAILTANDLHPPLTLRTNLNKVSRETLLKKLQQQEIAAKKTEFSIYGITLEKPTDVNTLEGFSAGEFSVQDEAAQLAAQLVDPKPGETILDACSAPGGKLLHMLELSPDKTTTFKGLELEPHRAERIIENFQRVQLDCELYVGDATNREWWDGKLFDKILLDAPCSATGVIRRNPDIKLLRKSEDIHSIAKVQKAILENLWGLLKNKGRIIYATCSIFPQENEKIISSFIRDHDDARHIKIDAQWGSRREHGRQLFPSADAHDGFYYAIIEKSSD